MSSVLDEREAYLNNPYFKKHEYGDFTPFYIIVTVCSVVGFSIFLLNIILGCCSRYSGYWNDRHTGNRWIASLWSATPRNQPPLDYTELQDISVSQQHVVYHHPPATPPPQEFLELKKRESDI
ncbi:wurmchen 1 transmembrane protein [Leptinotarsa decemlineata]|uniref:wurmchen 1 transmembrane protein n=1 Tax=Leptinotarsa decemlineata TaxID=7539 RepID=UPI000C25389F|nr:uncharacterized protein LOC111506590 [Leptinotarsa decemlineata]